MKRAIIIGASSGIGYELAKILSMNHYEVGLVGRRTQLLEALQAELKSKSYVKTIDISDVKQTFILLNELIVEMKDIDLIIISAGLGHMNEFLNWELEKETIDVNVTGFTAITNIAMSLFKKQGYGHLVGISSIAAIRGSKGSPSYNASKAYVSNYLEGLRQSVHKSSIFVTDVQPGFVNTKMAQGDGMFWIAPLNKACNQIYNAIIKRKKHVYITKRWRLIAWILKNIPSCIYEKM